MARIDFYRGKQSDDRTNAQWKEWAKKLKNVWEESRLMNRREDVSAQWMESMVGVSYHAANGGEELVSRAYGSVMEIRPNTQHTIAKNMWQLFERLGVGPRNGTRTHEHC